MYVTDPSPMEIWKEKIMNNASNVRHWYLPDGYLKEENNE